MDKQAFNYAFDLGIREIAIELEKKASDISPEAWAKAFAASEGGEAKDYFAKGKAAHEILKKKSKEGAWYNPDTYVASKAELAKAVLEKKSALGTALLGAGVGAATAGEGNRMKGALGGGVAGAVSSKLLGRTAAGQRGAKALKFAKDVMGESVKRTGSPKAGVDYVARRVAADPNIKRHFQDYNRLQKAKILMGTGTGMMAGGVANLTKKD